MLEKITFTLKKGASAVSNVCNYIGAGLLNFLVVLTVAEVVLRRFFNAPVPASMELTEIIIGMVIFLSIAYCGIKGGHISIDIVVSKFPRRIETIIVTVMYFFSMVMSGVLTWQFIVYAMKLSRTGDVSIILELPTYPFIFIGALGFALFTLALLIDFMSNLAEVRK